MSETDEELLDVRGRVCPEPVLAANRRLKAMAPGARLRLVADDPVAYVDIQHFCRQRGHAILALERDGPVTTFLIQRADEKAQ